MQTDEDKSWKITVLLLGHVSDRRHNCFENCAQESYALQINEMNEKEKKLQFKYVSETIAGRVCCLLVSAVVVGIL